MKAHKLKPLEYAFANHYARGCYTEPECVELAYERSSSKDAPKNLRAKAQRWLKQPNVMGYIKYLRKEIEKTSLVDAVWVRQELVSIVKNGKHSDARSALDTLNKMNGYYEKDNTQKQAHISLNLTY